MDDITEVTIDELAKKKERITPEPSLLYTSVGDDDVPEGVWTLIGRLKRDMDREGMITIKMILDSTDVFHPGRPISGKDAEIISELGKDLIDVWISEVKVTDDATASSKSHEELSGRLQLAFEEFFEERRKTNWASSQEFIDDVFSIIDLGGM